MAVIYATEVKSARMEAVRNFLHGGYLELLGGDTRLVVIRLPMPFGHIEGATLRCDLTEAAFADAKGRATAARICDSKGDPVITGLTIGKTGDVRLDNSEIEKGQVVSINSIAFTHA
jgi:hypothetical protein